ncbi:DUF4114 domain-containing protein [Microcoleus sp. FACHB-672]|uniref:DUF4114 domain-containing protein n=1 Tax=Microcoleus sp. FACHB-672 TaxID=2692825 RepID=UPI0016886AF7|nr:DUF4114 domain-containing protein [Microcoleus sp. FACHB-672]MBD2041574.1 DUF4114 domain-containing protein [Microcoleus sp. FACHB-672]
MKSKLFVTATAAATATALLSFSAPAQASFSFGTSGIKFAQDTTVNFSFIQSKGANISRLGIYDANKSLLTSLFQEKGRSDAGAGAAGKASEWLGTAANIAGSTKASYTFLANTVYSLGLYNQGWVGNWTVFSTSSLNTNGNQQTVFNSAGGSEGSALSGVSSVKASNPFVKGGTLISFEDTKGGGDRDFNDFTVNAEAVPEPFTMSGLALGLGGLAAARRRRNQKTA